MISGFNTEREVAQLRIAKEYHESQIERIEERIDELKDEWNNRVSLVTGKIGVGKTTYAVELAYHSMRPVISNLESHEHATYAESREEVRDIVEDSSQQYTVLIDDCSAQISAFANSVGEVRAFAEEMIDLGHRVILVGPVRSDFAIYERFENSETLAGKIEEYHLPERGVVEYSLCQFAGPDYPEPVETPSSSFDTTEIPEFDFSEPVEDELNLFDPDDWPPQFHIDNLEMQLDFNLGQVYGFCDLDRQSQADLAKLAVEYELDRASVQNILNICRQLGSLDGDCDDSNSARAGDSR